jgi:hypothetical protein
MGTVEDSEKDMMPRLWDGIRWMDGLIIGCHEFICIGLTLYSSTSLSPAPSCFAGAKIRSKMFFKT